MEIGGLEWMGVVHDGIIEDTLPRVLHHSSLPLRIHLGGMSSGIGTCFVVVNIDLKGCKLVCQVDRYLFFLGAKRDHKVVGYYYYYFQP
jgi:hypothetical protein